MKILETLFSYPQSVIRTKNNNLYAENINSSHDFHA